jgi:putative tryptophan/tyrosine transport system substrate-binding protein
VKEGDIGSRFQRALRRRDLIAMLGGAAAAWPGISRAEPTTLPVIGFIGIRTEAVSRSFVAAFRRGLAEQGLEEGRTVKVEYRWTEGDYGRVDGIAAELIGLRPTVIYTFARNRDVVSKIAAAGIPVVFSTSDDPVAAGFVPSLARPGGNITGVRIFISAVSGKRLAILHQLVPKAAAIAVLQNPQAAPAEVEAEKADVMAAAQRLGVAVSLYEAASDDAIDNAFVQIARSSPGGLLEIPSPFFAARRDRIVSHATALGLPAIYETREFAAAGGLISYGDNLEDAYRLIGGQVGKIVKGARPADLPVLQSTKFETVLNLKTAKALGIEVPTLLLASVDEVIE